jgi:hypothetical protein
MMNTPAANRAALAMQSRFTFGFQPSFADASIVGLLRFARHGAAR